MPANPSCAPEKGVCDTIRFSIDSNYPDYTAEAYIMAVPVGFTIDDVPGNMGYTGTLIIHDPIGCFLNEPGGTMLGRQGWAKYMTPRAWVPPSEPEPYPYVYPPGPYWEIFSLCCNYDVGNT